MAGNDRGSWPRRRRLVVDGMNVIGARPDGWWRDRAGAMRRLVAALEAAAPEWDSITVVFDGAPVARMQPAAVTVRFASRRGRDAADDDIAALVAGDGDPGSVLVVTSDRELAGRVRSRGAGVAGAPWLGARLRSAGAALEVGDH